MKKYYLNSIADCIKNLTIINPQFDYFFTNPSAINSETENSISWLKGLPENYEDILNKSKASFIVCNHFVNTEVLKKIPKIFILCENPKETFIDVLTYVFSNCNMSGVHPTSIISENTKIGKNCFIGPNVFIDENCIIGNNVKIIGNNFIFSKTIIGNNVTINPGTVIGSDGFGYSRGNNNKLKKFPHFGGVFIGNDVEIGSNVCIDRGTLDNTIIKSGVKIDNLVHVAHNVEIGEDCLIIANSMIGGSTKIGHSSWIAPSVNLMNGITIGHNTTVGMGSTVTKSIEENQTWTGSPAMPLSDFITQRNKIKKL